MHRIIRLIICFLLLALTTAGAQPSGGGLTPGEMRSRDIFRELIEINTTVNNGCTKAAEAMARRLETAGFDRRDMELAGPGALHRNLVVRFRGSGWKKPVLFIGHLDVVEARREDWSLDPFRFTERDGYFYGRGTNDMKCEDADVVANFIRLREERFVPDRDIILALTDDEESGDANGVSWLLANRRPLIDAEFSINLEGGGGDISRGRKVMMEIQTGEKVYISYRMEVKNPGGHSSLPVKENAIYRLAAALTRLAQFDFPPRLNETTRIFFERSALAASGRMKEDMRAILAPSFDTAAGRRLSDSSAYYNAMMRTTAVATRLSAGHADNALPQTASAVVNCRMLPDEDPGNVLATLARVVADDSVTITPTGEPFLSPISPLREDVLAAVESLTRSVWPGVVVTPVMSTGASDGRLLRHAGIPVYGVSGMFSDIDDVRAHGRDERIGVREFYEGVEFMYRFIKTLTSGS